jgi:two-component system sensor histidine kinase CpxA
MSSIFAKILVWFLGTVVLSLAGFVATSVLLSSRSSHRRDFVPNSIAMQVDDARLAYEEGGPEKLARYLKRLERFFPDEHLLTDADGRDLVSGEDRSELLDRAETPPPWPYSPSRDRHVHVHPSDDGRYRFVILFRPRVEVWGFLPYYLWILLIVALLCYILAVHLASPLRNLRRAMDRFGRGDLSARAHSSRKDEIGDLARAFDRMAERIETLLTAERRLLQDVSHELRSPLARLGFAIELARTTDDRELALGRIKKDVGRLSVLVDELLQLTRAEGDPSSRTRKEVVLSDLLRSLVEDCTPEAEAKGCRLNLLLEGVTIRGDRELLRRAVENILRNAIRHAPEGTSVEVSLRESSGSAVIAIRDHGTGVPEEYLGRIFKPFFRVDDDRSRSSGGVGLGLSIARRAIGLHRGQVSARNEDPGLCVTIELPIRPPQADQDRVDDL